MLFLNRQNKGRHLRTTFKPLARRSCALNLEGLEQRLLLDGNSADGFFKLIADDEAGQLLSLSANALQVGQALVGLFTQDPAAKIIDRIDLLQKDIDQQFQDLGALLNKEIQNVVDNERTLANQDAIAHAVTAERDLYDYKLTGDKTYLAFAGNESSLATAFLEQQSDPFYIGGLVCAGNARIDFFRALEPDWAQDPVLRGEVNQLINSLSGMITTVQQTVESNHTVGERSELSSISNFYESITLQDHFISHVDKGEVISSFLYESVPVGSTRFHRGGPPPRDGRKHYTFAAAEAAAAHDRLVGISNELTFLSIPQFEQILNIWKDLAATLVVTAPNQTMPGVPFNLTISAVDGSGNIDTSYRGTVTLTSTDPGGHLPAAYTFTAADKGVHTFAAGATLVTVGSQSITASDTARAISASASVVVTPGQVIGGPSGPIVHRPGSTQGPVGQAASAPVTSSIPVNEVSSNPDAVFAGNISSGIQSAIDAVAAHVAGPKTSNPETLKVNLVDLLISDWS